jgi:hypothetical protein
MWRLLASWITTPLSARQAAASTCHSAAAADTSMARAVAPARRIGSQDARTAVDPPVAWSPATSGLP